MNVINIDLNNGRQFLISRNLIPNLLKNINIASVANHIKATSSGLTILDNVSKVDEGKLALKQNNAVVEIGKILEISDYDENVVEMGSKIFSKICTMEDLLKELQKIEIINLKQDYSECIYKSN